MYRCCMCDAPALMNCECYTQLEQPGDSPNEDERIDKICIASGEDAIVEEVSVGS